MICCSNNTEIDLQLWYLIPISGISRPNLSTNHFIEGTNSDFTHFSVVYIVDSCRFLIFWIWADFLYAQKIVDIHDQENHTPFIIDAFQNHGKIFLEITSNLGSAVFKGVVKRAEPYHKCHIRLVSRILWHNRIIPSLKEWRFWYLILTCDFPS